MVQETAERLTTHLRDELGDGLRTVAIVYGDSQDIHYLRNDLRGSYTEQEYAQVVETFRRDDALNPSEIEDTPLGERRAVVHYHENAFVLKLLFSASESILISVTPETGRSLRQFIDDCRQIIQA